MKPPVPKEGWVRTIILLILYIVVCGIFEVLYVELIYFFSSKTEVSSIRHYQNLVHSPGSVIILLFSQSFQIIGLLVISLIFYRWIDRPSILKLVKELHWKSSYFTYGCVLGVVLISMITLVIWSFDPTSFSYQGLGVIPSIVNLGLFILIAINEEVFARGMILGNLSESYGKLTSLIASSIFFAGMHVFNDGLSFIGFSNLILTGLLLGMVYLRTNNLWMAIGLHFTWNLFQGPVYGFEVSGKEVLSILKLNFEHADVINGGAFGLEGSILTTILMILVCGYYLWVDRKMYFTSQRPAGASDAIQKENI